MTKKKKKEIVQSRISPDLKAEFAAIVKKEYGSDRKISEAIRDLIQDAVTGKKKIKREKKPNYQAVETMLFNSIKTEIRKIGSNINRWTTLLQAIRNKNEFISKSTEEKLQSSIDMLTSHILDIGERITKLTDNNGT